MKDVHRRSKFFLIVSSYDQGFKDGVKAHKKEVKKHYDEICEHFGI